MTFRYMMTGGSGLIGKALEKRLFKEGHSGIYNIDLKNNRAINDINHLDIFPDTLNIDVMFHLASPVKINRCIKYPALAHRDICNGTFEVLEFCKRNKIKKIVYLSSSRVLSQEKNPYTAAKIYGEELVRAYAECYGMKYIIIRPSTVYGKGDESNRLIQKWINESKLDEDLHILGDKQKTLSFTYIDDFIEAVIGTIHLDWNKEYNIAGKEEKLTKVAKIIKQLTESKGRTLCFDPETAQPQIVKIMSDFECPTDIEDGIKKCM